MMTIHYADAENTQQLTQIIDVIRESIYSCVADHHNDETLINEWLANKTVENLATWIEHGYALVYLDSTGQVIGFLMAVIRENDNPKSAEIMLNYVSPKSQKQGIGKQLLDYAKQDFLKQNIQQIVAESTLTAKGFYQHNGFDITNEVFETLNEQKTLVAYQMDCNTITLID